MRVLGIDPGLNTTGYCILEEDGGGPRLIEAGVLRTKSSQPLERRLHELYTGIMSVIEEFAPDALSIEDLYAHYKHPKTAVIMGHARGVFFLAAGAAGLPVHSYAATRIKKSLSGGGHATKQQVARLTARILGIDEIPGPADVTDAVATALCHFNTLSHTGELQ